MGSCQVELALLIKKKRKKEVVAETNKTTPQFYSDSYFQPCRKNALDR